MTLLQKGMDATFSWRKWEKVVKIYPKYLLIAHKKAEKYHQSRRKLIANVEKRVIAAESLMIVKKKNSKVNRVNFINPSNLEFLDTSRLEKIICFL